jgi:voltage-gated potassium channel Kch
MSEAGRKLRAAPRPNLVERRMSKFLREPPSVRTAASVIVTATAIAVVAGGVGMRLLDHSQYPNIWVGMWWALQTVTTVGYGDVTPTHPSGRIVASVVMLEGIAFLAIVTAGITSTFVARAQRERGLAEAAAEEVEVERLEARFDEMGKRLERIEALLRRRDDTN